METIQINGKEYYHVSEVKKNRPCDIFETIKKGNIRSIIRYKKLKNPENYIYGAIKDDLWSESNAKYPRAKIMFVKTWLDKYYEEYNKTKKPVAKIENSEPVHIGPKNGLEKTDEKNKSDRKQNDRKINEKPDDKTNDETDNNIMKKNTLNEMPAILKLEENEKMRDIDGRILEIEVRGERHPKKCYFNAENISTEFRMPRLLDVLKDGKTGKYKEKKDYVYINTEQAKEKLYFTYQGLMRMLFVSKNNVMADRFQDWACEILFTVQFGSVKQKKQLCKEIIGTPYEDLKSNMGIFGNELSCVYLTILGQVKDLRESMNIEKNISEENYVCKYGFTKHLRKRMNQHKQEFKTIKNVELSLKSIILIDPKYISDAETEIKEFVFKYALTYKDMKELIIVNKKEISEIEKYYNKLIPKYQGYNNDMSYIIKDLQNTIKNKELIIKDQKMETMDQIIKNKELETKLIRMELELELFKKELEIKTLRDQINKK